MPIVADLKRRWIVRPPSVHGDALIDWLAEDFDRMMGIGHAHALLTGPMWVRPTCGDLDVPQDDAG